MEVRKCSLHQLFGLSNAKPSAIVSSVLLRLGRSLSQEVPPSPPTSASAALPLHTAVLSSSSDEHSVSSAVFRRLLCHSICRYRHSWPQLHLFPANLGDSACISEIVQAVSAVRQFGGRSGIIRQPQCRTWLHFYRITCKLSKIGQKKVYSSRPSSWIYLQYTAQHIVNAAGRAQGPESQSRIFFSNNP